VNSAIRDEKTILFLEKMAHTFYVSLPFARKNVIAVFTSMLINKPLPSG
jgi:hypothetical protein